uniref:Uncharacterized protein n=1 Tax=Chromera velia CCMP2878 TaxID=1169474 RepID=A0A0G4HQ18_9ALVE|eukprot:Cvel_30013.t1-p1 / transcript=Cvel_30013.t1 / gene=Cvel_30013 / organism=Chromera_velia_CCMP2878 / gene_product=hypothetical protein / transcript_product=hypothetical protein / location=Cvel_scaffold4214:3306-10659(+) / protein_length=1758 / sequence_SO=supercontig / SO=protein_coding / is_pseudo=false
MSAVSDLQPSPQCTDPTDEQGQRALGVDSDEVMGGFEATQEAKRQEVDSSQQQTPDTPFPNIIQQPCDQGDHIGSCQKDSCALEGFRVPLEDISNHGDATCQGTHPQSKAKLQGSLQAQGGLLDHSRKTGGEQQEDCSGIEAAGSSNAPSDPVVPKPVLVPSAEREGRVHECVPFSVFPGKGEGRVLPQPDTKGMAGEKETGENESRKGDGESVCANKREKRVYKDDSGTYTTTDIEMAIPARTCDKKSKAGGGAQLLSASGTNQKGPHEARGTLGCPLAQALPAEYEPFSYLGRSHTAVVGFSDGKGGFLGRGIIESCQGGEASGLRVVVCPPERRVVFSPRVFSQLGRVSVGGDRKTRVFDKNGPRRWVNLGLVNGERGLSDLPPFGFDYTNTTACLSEVASGKGAVGSDSPPPSADSSDSGLWNLDSWLLQRAPLSFFSKSRRAVMKEVEEFEREGLKPCLWVGASFPLSESSAERGGGKPFLVAVLEWTETFSVPGSCGQRQEDLVCRNVWVTEEPVLLELCDWGLQTLLWGVADYLRLRREDLLRLSREEEVAAARGDSGRDAAAVPAAAVPPLAVAENNECSAKTKRKREEEKEEKEKKEEEQKEKEEEGECRPKSPKKARQHEREGNSGDGLQEGTDAQQEEAKENHPPGGIESMNEDQELGEKENDNNMDDERQRGGGKGVKEHTEKDADMQLWCGSAPIPPPGQISVLSMRLSPLLRGSLSPAMGGGRVRKGGARGETRLVAHFSPLVLRHLDDALDGGCVETEVVQFAGTRLCVVLKADKWKAGGSSGRCLSAFLRTRDRAGASSMIEGRIKLCGEETESESGPLLGVSQGLCGWTEVGGREFFPRVKKANVSLSRKASLSSETKGIKWGHKLSKQQRRKGWASLHLKGGVRLDILLHESKPPILSPPRLAPPLHNASMEETGAAAAVSSASVLEEEGVWGPLTLYSPKAHRKLVRRQISPYASKQTLPYEFQKKKKALEFVPHATIQLPQKVRLPVGGEGQTSVFSFSLRTMHDKFEDWCLNWDRRPVVRHVRLEMMKESGDFEGEIDVEIRGDAGKRMSRHVSTEREKGGREESVDKQQKQQQQPVVVKTFSFLHSPMSSERYGGSKSPILCADVTEFYDLLDVFGVFRLDDVVLRVRPLHRIPTTLTPNWPSLWTPSRDSVSPSPPQTFSLGMEFFLYPKGRDERFRVSEEIKYKGYVLELVSGVGDAEREGEDDCMEEAGNKADGVIRFWLRVKRETERVRVRDKSDHTQLGSLCPPPPVIIRCGLEGPSPTYWSGSRSGWLVGGHLSVFDGLFEGNRKGIASELFDLTYTANSGSDLWCSHRVQDGYGNLHPVRPRFRVPCDPTTSAQRLWVEISEPRHVPLVSLSAGADEKGRGREARFEVERWGASRRDPWKEDLIVFEDFDVMQNFRLRFFLSTSLDGVPSLRFLVTQQCPPELTEECPLPLRVCLQMSAEEKKVRVEAEAQILLSVSPPSGSWGRDECEQEVHLGERELQLLKAFLRESESLSDSCTLHVSVSVTRPWGAELVSVIEKETVREYVVAFPDFPAAMRARKPGCKPFVVPDGASATGLRLCFFAPALSSKCEGGGEGAEGSETPMVVDSVSVPVGLRGDGGGIGLQSLATSVGGIEVTTNETGEGGEGRCDYTETQTERKVATEVDTVMGQADEGEGRNGESEQERGEELGVKKGGGGVTDHPVKGTTFFFDAVSESAPKRDTSASSLPNCAWVLSWPWPDILSGFSSGHS